ncbi:MAG: hypothetical protein OXG13_02270 [Gemmatimonadaceae bacterium]|nr:hypothetical protein [Gemmatimonadaceae bacterium]
MATIRLLAAAGLILTALTRTMAQTGNPLIQEIIRTTAPLEQPRGERLPLYLWPAHDLGTGDEAELEALLGQLEARGIAAIANWRPDNAEALDKALHLGSIQKRLGLPITVNATSCTYSFFNGDEATAHVDADGQPFFDPSFGPQHMGCPFAVDSRTTEMRRRIAEPVAAYDEAGLDIHMIFADWEIDGPIEWNEAWDHSRRCMRCRARIPEIDDFSAFQGALRRQRSYLQRHMLAEPVLARFPSALVGNYAVYPHNGERYWFDYFEKHTPGTPHRMEGGARYRQWYPEFDGTGYTFAMPVVYTWQDIYGWYDFDVPDYRWFYNMLLVGSNAGESTPAHIPLITFVHWHTVILSDPPPDHPQFGEEKYHELLWHLLLRGHDALFMWSPHDQALKESQLAHQVYAESHAYRDFLAHGTPVSFTVPKQPGPVVSALRWDDRLLVRRTDFTDTDAVVELEVDGRTLGVPRLEGGCRILMLD